MRQAKIVRLKDNRVLADPCLVADSVWTRFMGLMGKDCLEKGAGLLIEPCNSIHTFFMKFSIDAIYLDREFKVMAIRRGMQPWRVDFPVFGAASVLELPEGQAGDLEKGDLLCLS